LKLHPLLAAAALSLAVVPLPAVAQGFDAAQKQEIGETVREYLMANPEVLVEVMGALEQKRNAQSRDTQKQAIAAAGDALFATPEGATLGNPEGDVTLVEFFDYNCGYCKRAHADMQALLEADPQLRVVLHEIPVLGPESVAASRVSLAFRNLHPDKYGEFQSQLLMSRSTADEDRAIEVAVALGAGEADIRAAMANSAIEEELDAAARMAVSLQISGTPSYVIGDEMVPGAVGADALAGKIANVRACGSATCS